MPNATILMVELVVTMTIQLGMIIVLIVNAFNKNFSSYQTKKHLIDFKLTMYLKKPFVAFKQNITANPLDDRDQK